MGFVELSDLFCSTSKDEYIRKWGSWKDMKPYVVYSTYILILTEESLRDTTET
jgi:hypothetical protein